MKLFALFSIMLITAVCFAVELEVPEGDPLAKLLELITNWKTLTPIAIGSGAVVVVQLLRKFLPTSNIRRALVVVLGVAWAVFQGLLNGMGALDMIVMVLLTSGGAVLIYEAAIKPFLKKEVQRLG